MSNSSLTSVTDKSETPVAPVAPVNHILGKLQFIVLNLEKAQEVKGGFTMQECKAFVECVKPLVTLFSPSEESKESSSEEKVAGSEEVEALSTLTHLCEIQQSKGVFSINGSVMILEALEEINEALCALKSQDLKFKELQAKIKHGKSKK